jgi:polyphosphate kinase
MIVYRTSDDSPFVPLLIQAAEAGKQVACLVELLARFDEQRNIRWANALEDAGVHVVYGILGVKTHTKATVVVRRDPDMLRTYAHIGTGNYNPQTAKLYTDLGLFTCQAEITADLVELFHSLTGRSLKQDYDRLLVAPVNMKERFLAMIHRERDNHLAGRPAHIVAKMNQIEDREIVRALYQASQAGVPIDLVIRGFCTLRPGVPELSPTIRVFSVIGRFLEHSRIFYFRNATEDPIEGEFYIGSADWMYRNLESRVEAIAPILSRAIRERCWEILQVMLNDQRQTWDMQPDGSYRQRQPGPDTDPVAALGAQQVLMDRTRQRNESGSKTVPPAPA